ncbi:glycosyltransferase family 39 protein [Hamadaea sp. NPDC050747]|uniref:glycosyltransferase family 39 protein n=1 Tax=Hamadaea sp. NPDC050747 TaxID=3155789 RepID=UPI0033C6768C
MADIDQPTRVLRPAGGLGSTDLWDDLVRLSRRVEYDTTQTLARQWSPWLVPTLATLVIGAVALGNPGLWTDELATWGMATTHDWSQFWWVLRYVDAVLAPYYVFTHEWVRLFGDSDLSLRTPSLLAMAASAGLIGALGRRLSGSATGLIGGLVFAVLPSTSRFAAEARPYALTVLAATAATYLLVSACRQPSAIRWIGYAAAISVLGLLNVVGLLLLAGHAWVLMAWHRRQWWRFGLAAGVGLAMCVPLLMFGTRQSHQVSYIPPVSFATFGDYSTVLFGGTALSLLVIGIGLFGLPLRWPSAVFAGWAIVPVLALIVVSFVMPMFLPRYLLFTTPGWALLAGAALARVRPRWAGSVVLVVALLGLPVQAQIRSAGGHEQATAEMAAVIAANVRPGDAIVYADDEPVGSWTARDAVAHYVPADRRPADLLATNSPRHDGLLLATECADVAGCLKPAKRVWVLRIGHLTDPLAGIGPKKDQALRARFHPDRIWYPDGLTLALLEPGRIAG